MESDQVYVWVNHADPLLLVLLALVLLLIEFLPSFIAFSRDSQNRYLILIFNILFGWTGILWIVLLVWSYRDERVRRSVMGR